MKQLHFREVFWISWCEPFPRRASERTSECEWNGIELIFARTSESKTFPQALSYTSVTNVRDYYSVLASQRCVHLSFFGEHGTLSIGCFSIRSRNRWKTMYTQRQLAHIHPSTLTLISATWHRFDGANFFTSRLNRFVKIYQMSKKEIELWRRE